MTELLHSLPLATTLDRVHSGERTVREELQARLDRLAAVEPDIEAFVDEENRRERVAEAADRSGTTAPDATEAAGPGARGPLAGAAVGVKDIFHVDGLPTRAGSDLPPEALVGPEATVVTRLREAGAVVIGKTVTTEFAYFEPGPTRNPHDTGHTPGGSSSGSAAAVAAGECPLALGTQTAGSTIRPAAFCGIVGLKPSYGRIPVEGILPLAPSLDHVGLFTQDVPGMVVAASVVYDDWTTPTPTADPVLGVPEGPYLDQAEPEGRDGFEEAVDALADAGYTVRRVDAFEHVGRVNEAHTTLLEGEAAAAHHGWYEAHGDRYAGTTAELVERGRAVTVGDLAAARASRLNLRERLTDRMAEAGIDCWIAPAAPGPAPGGLASTGDVFMNVPWTHAGLPVVTVPAGSAGGLPLGVQAVARFGADERLLRRAAGLADALATL